MPIENSEVIGIFPTPFMFVTVDEETRKKVLEEVLKEFKTNCEDAATHFKAGKYVDQLEGLKSFCKASGTNTYQSNPDLQKREEFSFFNDILFDACRIWEEETNIDVETFDISLMWSNFYRATGGGNGEHFHPNSFLSCVYIIEDPSIEPVNGVKHKIGSTTFYSPVNQNFVITPSTGERGSMYYNPTMLPSVKKGDLLMFPSRLRHAADPYHLAQDEDQDQFRITISANIMIRGNAGKVETLTYHNY